MEVKEQEKREEEEGDPSETPSAIEVAEKLHAQIKAENDRHEALIERQEKLAAQNMLGGKSRAGNVPEKPKELTPEEYKDKVMAGEVPNEN